jgi:radical SAM-linked protein
MWERALRRSGLPVAWSEGFSPHPQISFGLALPTGAESVAEYLDVVLASPGTRSREDDADARREETLEAHLSRLLPAGIDVRAVATVPFGSSSLQREVTSCSWKLEVLGLAAEELGSRVERLLAAPSVLIERERKGRAVRDDLRPAVLALEVSTPPGPPLVVDDVRRRGVWLDAELATRPRGVRPGELLEGLGDEVRLARACRMHQWIERDGARLEPLPVGSEAVGAVTAHVEGRAS